MFTLSRFEFQFKLASVQTKCCWIKCSVVWLVNSFYGITIYLYISTTISDGPKENSLQSDNKSYTVSEMGSINTISCSASCRPDCKFVWKGPNIFEIQQFNLKFESVLRNQSRIYVCYASNNISSSMSQSISVIVNCKHE